MPQQNKTSCVLYFVCILPPIASELSTSVDKHPWENIFDFKIKTNKNVTLYF